MSDNIRIIREGLNYSQEDVAERMNLSQQAYSLIEKNPEKTSFKNLQKIASILCVNISTLIMEDEYFVQQNFNQQHCNIASQQHIASTEGYEKLIIKLEHEIEILKNTIKENNSCLTSQNVI